MRYYIRQQGKFVSGPHDLADIQIWIKAGKVREEMEFSEDQIDWIWGIELSNLFPPPRGGRRLSRRRLSRN